MSRTLPPWPTLMVCVNRRYDGDRPSCAARGSVALADWLDREIKNRGMALVLERSPCQNACLHGPVLRRLPGGELFLNVTLAQMPDILETLIAQSPEQDLSVPY